MTCSDDAIVLAELKADWPTWDVFRSIDNDGEPADWYAARWRVLTEDEMTAGLAHTLAENTADDLRKALAEQLKIETGRSEEPA
jgi:hypothetical protein